MFIKWTGNRDNLCPRLRAVEAGTRKCENMFMF